MSKAESPTTSLDTKSQPFVGRWNRLITTTNWEKGRIILAWREALIADDAAVSDYSDDAWAQRVSGTTGQHVGRLRRVFERFNGVHDQYENLFWSHFQVAIDWDDAEMWLEGAANNRWSVAIMRRQRADTLGELDHADEEDNAAVLDESDEMPNEIMELTTPATLSEKTTNVLQADSEDAVQEDNPAADGDAPARVENENDSLVDQSPLSTTQTAQRINNLSSLPDDLVDAFETFKLVILRYRAESWETCSRDDVVNVLESLQELAHAVVESDTP